MRGESSVVQVSTVNARPSSIGTFKLGGDYEAFTFVVDNDSFNGDFTANMGRRDGFD